MKRWIVVDWERREVVTEAFATKREAWQASTDRARDKQCSAYEFDQIEIEIEPQ